ncbi:MAG TPA: RnfABCDGE type electron transport complex subunit D [Spirochaetia bacterium]|nr:RnfABCDGE type electron transport complex subunit D [Spirochaetia bacterium]
MAEPRPLAVSPAPHVVGLVSSLRLTWTVAGCLLPAAAWGVFLFRVPALEVLGVAAGSALLAELLTSIFTRRVTLGDGSAFVTGLLIGLLMPPGAPLYVPAAASAFAILVVKQTFGGLGRNWMNPTAAGVVFALISWTGGMSQWLPVPGSAEGSAAVAPLEALRAAYAAGARPAGPLAVLSTQGYAWSGLDGRVLGWVNDHLLSWTGMVLPRGTFDLLIGNTAGRIGELSVPLLLLGAAWLLGRSVIRWQVPVAFLSVFCAASIVFGGLPLGRGWFAGGLYFQLFSGSIVLGAFFLATDTVTSPLTDPGRLIYGASLGVLLFFLRYFGALGDGVPLAIVLGNCLVPLIDRLTVLRGRARHREAA